MTAPTCAYLGCRAAGAWAQWTLPSGAAVGGFYCGDHLAELRAAERTCRHCGAHVPMGELRDLAGRPEFTVCPACSRTEQGYTVIA